MFHSIASGNKRHPNVLEGLIIDAVSIHSPDPIIPPLMEIKHLIFGIVVVAEILRDQSESLQSNSQLVEKLSCIAAKT